MQYSLLRPIILRLLSAAVFVVCVDQVSKKMAAEHGLIVLNTGVSFGLFSLSHPLFSLAVVIGSGVVLLSLLRQEWQKYPLSTGLFLGGAVSNLIDRVMFGGVRDWLSIGPLPLKNNLADWAIFAAVVLVLIQLLNDQVSSQVRE